MINLTELFNDSKTFVDKPTIRSPHETVAAFNAIIKNSTIGDDTRNQMRTATYGSLIDFVNTEFVNASNSMPYRISNQYLLIRKARVSN